MIPIDTLTGLPQGKLYDGHPDACYGVMCPQRATCQLHADLGIVDGTVIESCQQGRLWPLYRACLPKP